VTNIGVDFYKTNPKSHKLTHVKGFMQSAGHYWYHNGVLVIAASPPKLGLFYTFFLERGPKSLPGPRFNIDLSPSVTDNWTLTTVNASRVVEAYDSEPYLHRTLLSTIYGNTVFVHVNSTQSRLTLYWLFEDRVEVKDNFDTLPIGKFDIHCVDNILLVMNYTTHDTNLYDVQSSTYSTRPFCTFWNGVKPGQPELSISIVATVEKPHIAIQAMILYDGKQISRDAQDITSVRSPNEHILETCLDTNPRLVSLGPEFVLDIDAGCCYRITVDFGEVIREHPDRLESILFLFRRSGYCALGCDCLRQALRSRIPLMYLSSFFEIVNSVYRAASQERSKVKTRRSIFSGSMDDLQLMKTDSGLTVLTQADLVNSIFLPLFEEQRVEALYLTSVVLEYVRSLIALEIPVQTNLQMLLARLLVRGHSFALLQELVLYNTFSDTRDLAHLLLALASQQIGSFLPAAFQLGIDMLSRLRLYDEVTDVLLSRGYAYEVAKEGVAGKQQLIVDIARLQQATIDTQDPELIDSVEACLRSRKASH
jgi:hypothetical protein